MPTTISILSASQRQRFDKPPVFAQEDRLTLFAYNESARKYVRGLRAPHNKAGFILQYGYFRALGRFVEPKDFHLKDVKYVYQTHGLKRPEPGIKRADFARLFGGASATRHRQKILEIERWTRFDAAGQQRLTRYAQELTKKQAPPDVMLYSLVGYCFERKMTVPSYETLAGIVSQCYQDYEADQLKKIGQWLQTQSSASPNQLDTLLKPADKNQSLLSEIKRIEQSTRASSLKLNARLLGQLSQYYFAHEQLMADLELSDQAAEYLADWVLKARTGQVSQIKKRSKRYLYLLAFIQQQFYKRQDAALDGFMSCVKRALNQATKLDREYEQQIAVAKNKAVDAVRNSQKKLTQFVGEIIQIIEDATLSDKRKLEILRNRAIGILDDQDEVFIGKRDFLDDCREKESKQTITYEHLEDQSRALQTKVGSTVMALHFDALYSDPDILEAVQFYQTKKGQLGQHPPLGFLSKKERALVTRPDGTLWTSLYKMLLFRSMFDHIKAGKLSLQYSFIWRALQRYMIAKDDWEAQSDEILEAAGLKTYQDVQSLLGQLARTLEDRYHVVNERFSKGHNGELKMRPSGRFHVKTPATDYEKSKYISALLASEGQVPLLQVLHAVDDHIGFADRLPHHANRNAQQVKDINTVLAGIMALGCNIGPRQMARKSVGIDESRLLDCINWHFSNPNLNKINQAIVDAIEALPLPNLYKIEDNCIHSSSDGKKVTVAVDSLLANYSFKYYGREKGVAAYSFIDEKHSLFHPTVISSTDREAIYVIDGLLQNATPIHHIHSTDTHGFTEAVFGAMHLINVSFAPRFKRIEDQVIYSFQTKSYYQNQGYRVLPSRKINRKLIEDNWAEILRFMATIKLGHSSASQLFKRLNSYAKDHPLYQALKEFGRITKSLHILQYFDDLAFRQRIQKQLNRVELSNKFMDAVFWDRGKQFQVGTHEDQERYNLCKTIIQNTIIYWNYLFLTERLLSTGNEQDQADMLDSIKKGSVLAWRHINFSGEYDFTKPASGDYRYQFNARQRQKVEKLLKQFKDAAD